MKNGLRKNHLPSGCGKNRILQVAAALVLYATAYALINSELLIQSVLYRLAANDPYSAVTAFCFIAIQAGIFLALIVFFTRRLFWCLIVAVMVSAAINIIYSDILGDVTDASKLAWMIGELRQSANAAGQFSGAFILGTCKALVAIGLFIAVRKLLRPVFKNVVRRFNLPGPFAGAASVIALVSFVAAPLPTIANERSAFVYGVKILTAEPAPERAVVAVRPIGDQIEKIVWIIDESVSYDGYAALLRPVVKPFGAIDFGRAASLGNCSAPANVSLRSGVNVRSASVKTDLRTMPSIWNYAHKAGYKTMLLDGQTNGPPQNMLLPSERALIDVYHGKDAGMNTDRILAGEINKHLKSKEKAFVYAVLRGVHFQYTDHYPGGGADKARPIKEQYYKAIRYSKKQFFERLLNGADRSKIAVIYTSDHGQNILPDMPPHCSAQPNAGEFAVPLIAFLPDDYVVQYQSVPQGTRSTSQIFPATLQWMGYPAQYFNINYDNSLENPSAKLVWFGRNVTPVNTGDSVELNMMRDFPEAE